jgi:hypothetical protein
MNTVVGTDMIFRQELWFILAKNKLSYFHGMESFGR